MYTAVTPLPRKARRGRPRVLTPSNAHPLLRHALAVVDNCGATYAAVMRRAGVTEGTIHNIKRQANVKVTTLDHVLRATGYKLIIVPLDSTDR